MNAQLKELKKIIEIDASSKNHEAWFYPEHMGEKGFMGTQDMFLVGLNPSTGIFPSRRDNRLYSLLKEKYLDNIHITDFIKLRSKNCQAEDLIGKKDILKKQVEFLNE
jgi:hypothetical protein